MLGESVSTRIQIQVTFDKILHSHNLLLLLLLLFVYDSPDDHFRAYSLCMRVLCVSVCFVFIKTLLTIVFLLSVASSSFLSSLSPFLPPLPFFPLSAGNLFHSVKFSFVYLFCTFLSLSSSLSVYYVPPVCSQCCFSSSINLNEQSKLTIISQHTYHCAHLPWINWINLLPSLGSLCNISLWQM